MTAPGWYPDPMGGPGNRYWNGVQWDGRPAVEDVPDELHRAEKPSRVRLLVPALVGVVGLMGGMLLMLLWPRSEPLNSSPSSPTYTQPAPATTTEATTSSTAPTSAPTKAVAEMVRKSMQRKFDADPDVAELGLKVLEVDLVNKSGNEYKGIARIRAGNGVKEDVPVEVTADGDNVLWETSAGAFDFAIPDSAPPPKVAESPAAVPNPREHFTICPSGLSGVASEDTSCAFADNVRRSWYASPGDIITAYSPITHQAYTMQCSPASTTAWPAAKRCVGVNASGATLIVYIE